ncbi:hypothetical protein M8C21_032128, partial [Ambrosia artemisiifolia]
DADLLNNTRNRSSKEASRYQRTRNHILLIKPYASDPNASHSFNNILSRFLHRFDIQVWDFVFLSNLKLWCLGFSNKSN